MIYLDNAATTGKKPKIVIDAVNNALINYSANPGRSGHDLSVKCANAVYSARDKIATFFGADGPENVAFTLNCTQSINIVLKGVLNKGEHIVISNLEHNAVMRPLKKLGLSYDAFEVFRNDADTIEDFKRKIKVNTKLVMVTGASNVTGKTLPIEEIGNICKKRGIYFCVDAAQIAGIKEINMKKMNIDYLCIAPHKGLYAPMGIGVLICRKPIENTIIEGGTGSSSIDFSQPDVLPERLESGTVNMSGIMGTLAGIDFIEKTGIKKIKRHEFSLYERLYEGLSRNKRIKVYAENPDINSYMPVLSFNFKDIPSAKTVNVLNTLGFALRGGLHCAPTAHSAIGTLPEGTARVSVSAFNTKEEIQALINACNSEKILLKLLN
jgi:cysteine desulfurase family protein